MRGTEVICWTKRKCKGDVVFKCSKIISTNPEMNQSQKRRILIHFGIFRLKD